MVDRYCTECHDDTEQAGGLSLQGVTAADVAAHPEQFEKVVRRLRGGVMPPPGGKHPGEEQVDAFIAALEASLDASAAAKGPAPGTVAMHRLNRVEYATAVRDLLGIEHRREPDAPDRHDERRLRQRRARYCASRRRISTSTSRRRARSASRPSAIRRRSRRAPNIGRRIRITTRKSTDCRSARRDGVVVEHYFPADGEYVFSLRVSSEPGAELRAYPQAGSSTSTRRSSTVDGKKVFEASLGGEEDLREPRSSTDRVRQLRSRTGSATSGCR